MDQMCLVRAELRRERRPADRSTHQRRRAMKENERGGSYHEPSRSRGRVVGKEAGTVNACTCGAAIGKGGLQIEARNAEER
ncbi:hypothetical protein P3T76_016062 [Phytophthora citrophthora]|uniref:Uncharacterized protein n=1 Tax=Phytophthora citrophthora TaxID=4793 RepID=A0AAD9FY68_9STRA|nr:hypothetical protein P3T76_016062 [Phytophthora citrophthora]